MLAIAEPVGALIPVDSIAGVGLISLLAILIMLVVCLVTGLVAKARLARAFYQRTDEVIGAIVPSYIWTKVVLKNLSGHEDAEEFKPVLVRLDDQTQIGFEMERTENELVVVFFSGAPEVQSGTLGYVESSRVEPLSASLLAINKVLRQMGKGGAALIANRT